MNPCQAYRYARAVKRMHDAFDTPDWTRLCVVAESLRLKLPSHVRAAIAPHV